LAALALQCLNHEFSWLETPEETHGVTELCARVRRKPRTSELLVLGCYRPLTHWVDAAALSSRVRTPQVAEVLLRHVTEPLEEQVLRNRLWSQPASGNIISALVRAQYEAHPFPRWLTLETQPVISLVDNLRIWFPHFEPPPFLKGHPHVLVAGCGTGRHAILRASRHQEVRMLAVDLSRASLGYAVRRAKEFPCEHVNFQQADILSLPGTHASFHVIECGGVLNCFQDPLDGWRKLARLLVPGGLMCVALYSYHARARVRAVWSMLEKSRGDLTDDDIRIMRRRILDLPAEHPAKGITHSPDFYSMSGCKDLLFHVHEIQFTLPQISSMLNALGLRFIGFELHHPYVGEAYAQRFPEDGSRTNLTTWDVFEREHPEIFSGMYQFWCVKR
jgi:SAM-dependent methyltransferase